MTQFPGLFRMAYFKDATIQEAVSQNGAISHWNLTLVRSCNDCEEDNICSSLTLLASKQVLSQGNEEIVWQLNSKESFPVENFCSTQLGAYESWDVAAKSIWKSKAPTKVCFFAQAATKGRIPSIKCLKEDT